MKLSSIFGGLDEDTSRKLSLYLPNRDGDRKRVKNMEFWIRTGMDLMTQINGGCTTFYNLPGSFEYKNESGGFDQINEQTHVIYSYMFKYDHFLENSQKIRVFMYVYGLLTNQRSVMIDYSGPNEFGAFETGAVYVTRKEMQRYMKNLDKLDANNSLREYSDLLKKMSSGK